MKRSRNPTSAASKAFLTLDFSSSLANGA
jgi:hypothetical protein